MRVGLVGCTKSKRPTASSARDLYDPSTLFRGRRAFVERTCDRWFILSALYGLVDPDGVIEPYDVALKGASIAERRAWSRGVLASIRTELGDLRGFEFECHAGSEYLNFGVVDGLQALGATVIVPTEGLSFGRQLAFYSNAALVPTHSEATAAPANERIPPRPNVDALPPSPTPKLDPTEVVSALLEFGSSLGSGTLVAIGPDPESDELIRTDGFAFLLAVIFDQGIKYERAWRAPYELKQRLGYLNPARIIADPEAVRRAVD